MATNQIQQFGRSPECTAMKAIFSQNTMATNQIQQSGRSPECIAMKGIFSQNTVNVACKKN